MTVALAKDKDIRFRRRIESAASFADDVVNLGRIVPPRGAGRSAAHREDFCLRGLLVAQFTAGRLKLPLTVEARDTDTNHFPDFSIYFDDGEVLGIEHTDAGQASWQQWLSKTEGSETALLPPDGYFGDAPERTVVQDIVEAIRRKVEKARQRKAYEAVTQCDLMIYENSEGGILASREIVVQRLLDAHREGRLTIAPYAHVHLLIGKFVWLDLFGNLSLPVDVSGGYAEDWVGWLKSQAKLVREGRLLSVDAANLAEELDALARKERRALSSQLRRLLVHLLKLLKQPARSGRSWLNSVTTARDVIAEIIEESPSLAGELPEFIVKAYEFARRRAAKETGLAIGEFPAELPFTIDELLDEDFVPGDQP
jgi:hypothetical protein